MSLILNFLRDPSRVWSEHRRAYLVDRIFSQFAFCCGSHPRARVSGREHDLGTHSDFQMVFPSGWWSISYVLHFLTTTSHEGRRHRAGWYPNCAVKMSAQDCPDFQGLIWVLGKCSRLCFPLESTERTRNPSTCASWRGMRKSGRLCQSRR